jgi:hypothetical protein
VVEDFVLESDAASVSDHILIFGRNVASSFSRRIFDLHSRPLRMMPLCSFRISGTDYPVM